MSLSIAEKDVARYCEEKGAFLERKYA